MPLNRSKRRQSDPTGQASNRRKATRSIDVRLKRAQQQINMMFRSIRTTRTRVPVIVNQEYQTVYEYELTPEELLLLASQIRTIIDQQLETEGNAPANGWFWSSQIEQPYRQGVAEDVNHVNQLIAAAIIAGQIKDPFARQVQFEQIVQSPEYQKILRRIVIENYSTMKSLSERTASQVIQQINSGINGAMSPADISKQISERFGVSQSNAKRIADTEINRAYNDAKLNSAKIIQQQSGQRTAVLHISALLPETRDDHAARHGNLYSVEQQASWWDSGTNRINCKCSTSTALLDNDGNIMQTEEQSVLKAERRAIEGKRFTFGD